MKKILIVGATSDIAMATARHWLDVESDKIEFFLVGRSADKLDVCTADLVARGAIAVDTLTLDFDNISSYSEVCDQIWSRLERIDIALIAHGSLPEQEACSQDVLLTAREFFTNATSVICLLTALAELMQQKSARGSTIAVISSVAGDRGRESNYLYGSAKAAVSTFCDGLRIRLTKNAIQVTDIRPGMVDTAMTQGLDLPPALLASPEQVARVIISGIRSHRAVVYSPGYWRWIMLVIRSIPHFVFKRLNL